MLIYNAKVYTMAGQDYDCGWVRIENGLVAAAGPMDRLDREPGEDDFDAQGGIVMPGIVDAHSHIGIWEECIGQEGDDTNEVSDPATPQIRAIDAINVRDPGFKTALAGGVTTVVTGPGSANPIGGQFAAIKTAGEPWVDARIVKAPVCMKFALGENPKRVYTDRDEMPATRMATAAVIRENLQKAVEYGEKLNNEDEDKPDYDAKCEALLPVVRGELPAHFHAHRADDIMTAVRIAHEFKLRYAIIHATEAVFVRDALAGEDEKFLGCITGPIFSGRTKPELSNMTFASPGVLASSGINTAHCTDHQVVPENFLMLCAALCVKNGMDPIAALESVTISAARAAGIDNRVGAIKPGMDGDIVIFDRNPFDIFSKVLRVYIKGRLEYEND